jgi:hypothetical protein
VGAVLGRRVTHPTPLPVGQCADARAKFGIFSRVVARSTMAALVR